MSEMSIPNVVKRCKEHEELLGRLETSEIRLKALCARHTPEYRFMFQHQQQLTHGNLSGIENLLGLG